MMSHQSTMESVVDRAVPLLADDLYLLAHDRPGNASMLAARALNLGIAGALLAELALADLLAVEAGRLWTLAKQPPADSLAHEVLADLLSEPAEQNVPTWLEYLARKAPDGAARRVAERLTRAGVLDRQEHRTWLRTTTRYVPVDARSGWIAVRLCGQAASRDPVPLQDRMLVGLVGATDLTRRVFGRDLRSPDAYVQWCTGLLSPPLLELVEEVRAAVGRSVAAPI